MTRRHQSGLTTRCTRSRGLNVAARGLACWLLVAGRLQEARQKASLRAADSRRASLARLDRSAHCQSSACRTTIPAVGLRLRIKTPEQLAAVSFNRFLSRVPQTPSQGHAPCGHAG